MGRASPGRRGVVCGEAREADGETAQRGRLRALRDRGGMFASHGVAQNPESVRMLVLLSALAAIAYWRTVIMIVVTVLGIALIGVLSDGAFALWQSTHG